jgi:hypothetical protein
MAISATKCFRRRITRTTSQSSRSGRQTGRAMPISWRLTRAHFAKGSCLWKARSMTRAHTTSWTDCSAMFASGLQTALLQGVQHCRSPLGAGVEPRSPHAARRRDVSRWRGPVFPDRRFTVAMIGLGAADPKASPIALHGRIRFGTASRRLSAVRLWTRRWMNPNSAAGAASTRGIHQNRQGFTRTIRFRHPDKFVYCRISPTCLGRRWNLWAGVLAAERIHSPSPLPQARAGTLWAMGSALDHTHEERRCEA